MPQPANTSGPRTAASTLPWRPSVKSGPIAIARRRRSFAPDRCPKPGAIAVDPARRNREVLKIGSAIADRLQTGAMEEAGNVLRGDAPFGAERIAPAHFVRSEEVDVAFERRCRNRRETGVAVGGLQHGHG